MSYPSHSQRERERFRRDGSADEHERSFGRQTATQMMLTTDANPSTLAYNASGELFFYDVMPDNLIFVLHKQGNHNSIYNASMELSPPIARLQAKRTNVLPMMPHSVLNCPVIGGPFSLT